MMLQKVWDFGPDPFFIPRAKHVSSEHILRKKQNSAKLSPRADEGEGKHGKLLPQIFAQCCVLPRDASILLVWKTIISQRKLLF